MHAMGYSHRKITSVIQRGRTLRYPPHQKEETHRRIVRSAAREFRERGLQGIGVADLMASVGLTSGGFYGHFEDRDALLAEAVTCAAEESLALMLQAAAAAPGHELEAIIDTYLSDTHRADLANGCLLPAVSAEISRQSRPVRDAFTRSLDANLSVLAELMPGRDRRQRRKSALAFLASLAGALMLARAIDDRALSDEMLATVRADLLERLRRGRS